MVVVSCEKFLIDFSEHEPTHCQSFEQYFCVFSTCFRKFISSSLPYSPKFHPVIRSPLRIHMMAFHVLSWNLSKEKVRTIQNGEDHSHGR
jgi:hypothetical protein